MIIKLGQTFFWKIQLWGRFELESLIKILWKLEIIYKYMCARKPSQETLGRDKLKLTSQMLIYKTLHIQQYFSILVKIILLA